MVGAFSTPPHTDNAICGIVTMPVSYLADRCLQLPTTLVQVPNLAGSFITQTSEILRIYLRLGTCIVISFRRAMLF